MNTEYIQKFTVARIKPFKNYSTLSEKCVIYDTDERTSPSPVMSSDSDPFDDIPQLTRKFTVSAVIKQDSIPPILNVNLYYKNNRNFFYTTTPTNKFTNRALKDSPEVECEPVKLVSAKKITTGVSADYYETVKGKQIKRHYNNPFSSIEIHKMERWVKREGDKVTIKRYNLTKTRKLNSKYFRKNSSSTTITFDIKKGNFLVVIYESYKKKKKKSFYSNSFASLEQALPSVFKVNSFPISRGSEHYTAFIEEFDDQEFKDSFLDILMGKGRVYGVGYDSFVKDFMHYWMPRFVELKEIKLPNDGLKLLKAFYPTEKYLKKNNRKLVASILDRIGILSRVTNKILHNHPDLELRQLLKLCDLLGKNYPKYLGNVSDEFFERTRSGPYDRGFGSGFRDLLYENVSRFTFDISKTEKENMVHIMNDIATIHNSPAYGVIDQFYDHFIMRDKLRAYYPELSLNVKKWDTFVVEHNRYSAMERNIKKGYSTHLIFERQIVDEIEQPIEVVVSNDLPIEYLPDPKDQRAYERMYQNHVPTYTKYVFQPKLLRTSEDYSGEGSYMHHCVAGYIDYSTSIIVSLRCGTDRVTCEYSTRDKKLQQARYFSNKNAPDYYTKALKALDDRIRSIPMSIEPLEKRLVPLMINGKPVVPPPPDEDEDIFLPIRARNVWAPRAGNREIRIGEIDALGVAMLGDRPAPRRAPRLINNADEFRDIFGEPGDLA